MENADDLYQFFMVALRHFSNKEGWGGQTSISIGSKLSPSAISQIIHGSRKASFQSQIAIANGLGFKYDDFLKFGRALIETGKPPADPGQVDKLRQPPQPVPGNNLVVQFTRRSTDPPPDSRLQSMIDKMTAIYNKGSKDSISHIEWVLERCLDKDVKDERSVRKVKTPSG